MTHTIASLFQNKTIAARAAIAAALLVAALAKTGKFKIRVGAYPEPHPDAADATADVTWLKRKIDAGATSAITQFFFNPDAYFHFVEATRKLGATAPIVAGVMPGSLNFTKPGRGVLPYANTGVQQVPQDDLPESVDCRLQ